MEKSKMSENLKVDICRVRPNLGGIGAKWVLLEKECFGGDSALECNSLSILVYKVETA